MKEEQISPNVVLRTVDVVNNGQVMGFAYMISVSDKRDVVFHIDVSGSDNLVMEGGRLMKKSQVKAGSKDFLVGKVVVVNSQVPWSLQCRYTWTEKETSSKEIAKNIVLETTDMWTKGRSVTAVEYTLKVNMGKPVVFSIDFGGSTNLELATGGTKLKTLVEPHSSAMVAYLQVIKPTEPWSIKCKYDWSEGIPHKQVLGKPERKELGPGIVLVTTRSDRDGDTFQYQLAVSKNCIVDFCLDCSESTNMHLKGGETTQHTVVQPWDRAEVGLVVTKNPAKAWSLKCKFTWSERTPTPPTSGSIDETPCSNPSVNTLTEQLASVDLCTSATTGLNSFEVVRESGSVVNSGDGSSPATLAASQEIHRTSASVHSDTLSQVPKRTAPGLAPQQNQPAPQPVVNSAPPPVSNCPPHFEKPMASSAPPPVSNCPPHFEKPMASSAPPPVSNCPPHFEKPMASSAPPPVSNCPPQAVKPLASPVVDSLKPENPTTVKELAAGITLTTEQVAGPPRKFIYTVEVAKPNAVSFDADFTGSTNLTLKDADVFNQLFKRTLVAPHSKLIVAELTVKDPAVATSLRCKYRYEEQAPASIPTVSVPNAPLSGPPPGVTGGPKSAKYKLVEFLQGLELLEYIDLFNTEQIDWDLLKDMADNEDSLRATLKELGIARLGHREKIITAIRKEKLTTNK